MSNPGNSSEILQTQSYLVSRAALKAHGIALQMLIQRSPDQAISFDL